jgi:hypothetical protein
LFFVVVVVVVEIGCFFNLGSPHTKIPLISTSGVAGIKDVSHHAQQHFLTFN